MDDLVEACAGPREEGWRHVRWALPTPDAAWLCRALEPIRPFFVEDPLRSEHPASYRTLRPRTAVPLAAGEQLCSKWEFRELIEGELVDYLRLDLCIAGGFTEAAKVAASAETHQLRLPPTTPSARWPPPGTRPAGPSRPISVDATGRSPTGSRGDADDR